MLALVVLLTASHAPAQDPKTPYPKMAPLDQYLMERNAEIALARTAAPEYISKDAEVMVLGRRGYEVAVKGKNGFVCVVERSWDAGIDDPGFWNPNIRGPNCLNPPAARTYLPQIMRRTELILAGRSKNQMADEVQAAVDKKQLPLPESGAMCYMLSKQQRLNDGDLHWHPHLMFIIPFTEPAVWGANETGASVFAAKDPIGRLTIFIVPVPHWSDGTADSGHDH
jgi:hypothetical protein